jgi:type III secretion protein T
VIGGAGGMDFTQALGPIKDVEVYVMAAAIGLARMTGMIMVMPAFTRIGMTGILRAGVALALSLPLMPFIVASMTAQPLGFGQMAGILLKETFVGVTIGLVLGVPIWAAEAAGEVLDLQRGVTFAEMVDPAYTTHNNIAGTFFALVMVALYFASGGLSLTLRTVYDSYTLWPLTSFLPVFSADAGRLFLSILDDIFGLGLTLVIPIVLAMLLADVALALVARSAPHLNVFVLALTVKNFTFALLIVLYASFLLSYMRENLAVLLDGTRKLELYAPKRP